MESPEDSIPEVIADMAWTAADELEETRGDIKRLEERHRSLIGKKQNGGRVDRRTIANTGYAIDEVKARHEGLRKIVHFFARLDNTPYPEGDPKKIRRD